MKKLKIKNLDEDTTPIQVNNSNFKDDLESKLDKIINGSRSKRKNYSRSFCHCKSHREKNRYYYTYKIIIIFHYVVF